VRIGDIDRRESRLLLKSARIQALSLLFGRRSHHMGKYDGPHFECEDRDVVSIWVAHVNFGDIPENYMEYNRDGDDDTPWSKFTHNFGFGYYDDDFVESFLQPSKQKAPLYEQLKFLSYSSSFIDDAVREAQERSLDKTAFVFLMYNFAFDPNVTGIQRDDFLEFLGVFPFDAESEPVEKWSG
jgi:hypothetical protein